MLALLLALGASGPLPGPAPVLRVAPAPGGSGVPGAAAPPAQAIQGRPAPSIVASGRMPRPEELQAYAGSGISSITVLPPPSGAAQTGVIGLQAGVPPMVWQIQLADPVGTGYDESFLLQIPAQAAHPAPLLVAFHGFGVSEKSIQTQTTFDEECAARGWFLLAPVGATQVSFSSMVSQAHTEYVLGLLWNAWPAAIDRDRIYAAGFSMGGGAALNYAARHLDPTQPRIAAVVNHTGGVALLDSYANEPATQWIFHLWFHGPPAAPYFPYLRSSLFDFDPATLVVDGAGDLARNLTHVPVRSSYAQFDPIKYLVKQTDALHAHLTALGGTSQLVTSAGVGHTWSTLNEAQACDWLATHALATPSAASTLADRDGRFFHFDVAQDGPGWFTPFTWSADAASNRLELSATANLTRLGVDTLALGLDPAAPLELALSTADLTADEVLLSGYALAPASVLRDGMPAPTSGFTHDATAQTLCIVETDGAAPHVWRVEP